MNAVGELYWTALYPELGLGVLILVLLALEALFWPRRPSNNVAYLALIGCLLVLALSLSEWTDGPMLQAFYGMIAQDTHATFSDILLLTGAIATVLLSLPYLSVIGRASSEYYLLLLLATLGMLLLAAAADLVAVFLALGLTWLALYVLAALPAGRAVSNEAGIKCFVLGALGSAFFLCGAALVYGAVGTTSIQEVGEQLGNGGPFASGLLVPGMGLLLAGLGLKLGAVPFGMWAPDVQQGAPAPVTTFLTIGPRVAGFAALVRLLLTGFGPLVESWQPLVWVLAALSMVGGSLMALRQRRLKRMLAYAGIAQVGYLLLGLAAASPSGVASAAFYACVYTLTAGGAFAALVMCRQADEEQTRIEDYDGLGFRHPGLALAVAAFMLSLAGLPPTAGFVGRFYLFTAAVEAGHTGLACLGVASSLVLAACCLRVVAGMFMRPAVPQPLAATPSAGPLTVLVLMLLAILGGGVAPSVLMDAAQATVISIM